MAKKRTPLSITCEVNPFLQLVLMNVRKVFGHDDSLPFNAEVYVRRNNGILTHVANAWNDGWGGETNIDPISKDVQPLLIEAECEVEKYIVPLGQYSFKADLPLVTSMMASALLSKRGTFFKIEELLKW